MRPVFDPALALGALMGAHALEALHQILHGAADGDSQYIHKTQTRPKTGQKNAAELHPTHGGQSNGVGL